jgi:hypothetical protein
MPAGILMVRSALAPLLAEPGISSEQLTQLPRGREIAVVERDGEWLNVTARHDGYRGWLHVGYTGSPSGGDAVGISLGCAIHAAGVHMALPLGAMLFADDELLSGEYMPLSERSSRFPGNAEALCASARRYFSGTPYLWGGVSPWGADCSGFVQSVFDLHGISLGRDSQQQAAAGSPCDSNPLQHSPGELLFFSERVDGRITHVGLGLGAAGMMHVALGRGGAAMENFVADADDPYITMLTQRFRFARRPF